MESRWRDIVVLDYEVDFPAASRFEVALYGAGASAFPVVALGESRPWGASRRPGILDVPVREYTRVLERFGDLSTEPGFVLGLSEHFTALRRRLDDLNTELESHPDDGRQDVVAVLIPVLVRVMAFHVLNWALPVGRYRQVLTDVLGDADAAHRCLLELFVSIEPAHLSDFAEWALEAAQRMRGDRWSAAAARELFDLVEPLQAPAADGARFSDQASLERFVASLGAPREAEAIEAMRSDRSRAAGRLARSICLLHLAAGAGSEKLAMVEAIVHVCRFAAEEEEQRRRLQGRALRNLRRSGLDLDRVLPPGCGEATALREPLPVTLWPQPGGWDWQTC